MPKRQRPIMHRPQLDPKKRLYLIFDDVPYGYSIREIRLPRCYRSTGSSASGKAAVLRLPRPIFSLEAQRGSPLIFAAIGTKIVMTESLNHRKGGELLIPMYDTRCRGVTFGPGIPSYHNSIYIPVGDNLFVLDFGNLSKLSFESGHEYPGVDYHERFDEVPPWSWHRIHTMPFNTQYVNSYSVHSDGHTILVSTDVFPHNSFSAEGTFTFDTSDTRKCEWKKHGGWTLPFTGRAYFIRSLNALVGLSKDPLTLGHLTSCNCEAATLSAPTSKLGKENLFSVDPDESHVSARLIYTGSGGGSEFCLVQCVSVRLGSGNADDKNLTELSCRYRYRLTTFSLSYDDNGDLTTGETSFVQCYEVPRETSKMFINVSDPVAFWL